MPFLHHTPGRSCSHKGSKEWNQRLCQPEREGQLRPRHQQLRRQALEKRRDTLLPQHAADNRKAAPLDLKVLILYPGLDHVERRRHHQRRRRTADGCHKVLTPGRLVVVLELEEVLLGCGRAAEELRCWLVRCRHSRFTETRTANDPGKLRAIVQPVPR